MHFSLPSMRRRQHPLVRALSLLIGVALVAVLLVFGLFVAGILLVGGVLLLAVRQWKISRSPANSRATRPDSAQRSDVLEGEFKVIHRDRTVTH